ncbi:hypothetical protein L1887_00768 [Cichorium endivia]|nr:hypothetical protein L1887_00768 [Cichorium endivia]
MRFKKGSKVEVMKNVRYEGYQGVEKASRRLISPSTPIKPSLKNVIQLPISGSKIFQEEDDLLPKNRKRASPFCSSIHEPCQKVKKVKAHKKVDAFVGNKNKYIQASFNNCYYEMEKRKRKTNRNGVSRISETNDESDSDKCSVGSCSVDNVSSDGESLNISSDDVAVTVSIHRLELHAYRSTLEALYASGPLSWEKEALLTNLRINLHISNDEHLTELRNLISSRVN